MGFSIIFFSARKGLFQKNGSLHFFFPNEQIVYCPQLQIITVRNESKFYAVSLILKF